MFKSNKNRTVEIGKKVKVYYNLHKQTFSIEQNGLVVGYADTVRIENATYAVSEAGRQRVLKEKRKNVHATVRGNLLGFEAGPEETPAYYNPYKVKTFVKPDGSPLLKSDTATLINKQIKYA